MFQLAEQPTPVLCESFLLMIATYVSKSTFKLKCLPVAVCLILLLGLRCSPASAASREQVARGLESIQATRIRATLNFLASDYFKGRGTGTPETGLTTAYITSIFQRNGLHPAENQQLIQRFELCQALPKEGSLLDLEDEDRTTSFKFREEFLPAPWGSDSPTVEGEAVFVGYGVVAKEHQYDDYAGVDASAKVVVMLSKFPDDAAGSFDRLSPADYEDPMAKVKQAQAKGAKAALIILLPSDELPSSNDLTFRKARTYLLNDAASIRIPTVFVPYSTGEKIVQKREFASQVSLSEIKHGIDTNLRPQSFNLRVRIRIQTIYERKTFWGENVIGVIAGTDPSLRDRPLILGAHYDHLGSGENGETFYGADDDASGVTALLELAEAFRMNPVAPRHNIVFAAWGAEELGLLGSKYFAQNPLVPKDKIMAMIQMDMIGRNADRKADPGKNIEEEQPDKNVNTLNVVGSPFSRDLRSVLESCNQELRLELKFRFDFGGDNLNRRSDHWTFLREGVPSILLFTGFHPDYHRVTDTADKINFEKMEKILKLVYLTSWRLADTAQAPRFDHRAFEHAQ